MPGVPIPSVAVAVGVCPINVCELPTPTAVMVILVPSIALSLVVARLILFEVADLIKYVLVEVLNMC